MTKKDELLPWNWDHNPTGWGKEAPMAIDVPEPELFDLGVWGKHHDKGQIDYSSRAVWVLCIIGVVVGLPLLLGVGVAIEALITAINAARLGVE